MCLIWMISKKDTFISKKHPLDFLKCKCGSFDILIRINGKDELECSWHKDKITKVNKATLMLLTKYVIHF
jgi:hypothetical protein